MSMSAQQMYSTEIGQADQAPTVQPNSVLSITDVVSSIGLVVVLGACVHIGRKLQMLDDVKSSMGKIKNNVAIVTNFLIKNHEKFDPTELQTFSPYTLTEKGRAFVVELGFDKVFDENKEEFFKLIDNEKPKFKYDVENAAIKSMYSSYEKPFMSFLKVFFYNNPNRRLENVAPTLGVYVRDMYLQNHPEISE